MFGSVLLHFLLYSYFTKWQTPIFISQGPNDYEWAKNFWFAIPEDTCVKFIYNSAGTEFFYIFVKRIKAHGFVMRAGYNSPQIEMIRFVNCICADSEFRIIS